MQIFVGGFLRAAGHPHDHAQLIAVAFDFTLRLFQRFGECDQGKRAATGCFTLIETTQVFTRLQPGNLERFEVACRFRKRSVAEAVLFIKQLGKLV